MGNLHGSKYMETLADGRCAGVDVTAVALTAAQQAVQDAIGAFSWTGVGRLTPQ
jgi:hypothetical protein